MMDGLSKLFYAAVQDKPYAREKMAKLLDSLDVSREEDRMKINRLSKIALKRDLSIAAAIHAIAVTGSSDAWYILAYCQFYGLIPPGSLRLAAICLMKCKYHDDANRFGYDHDDVFGAL